MSDFWKLSDGNDVEANDSFDIGGGNIEVIPEGAQLLAAIDEARWNRSTTGERYISVRWTVLQPEELANRKVFQKIWVEDLKPEKKEEGEAKAVAYRDKAKRMLMAIDANAGGKLAAKGGAPTDIDLTSSLTMKPMVIRVGVVSSLDTNTGRESSQNWVSAVGPKTNPRTSSEELAKMQSSQTKAAEHRKLSGKVDDDYIPF